VEALLSATLALLKAPYGSRTSNTKLVAFSLAQRMTLAPLVGRICLALAVGLAPLPAAADSIPGPTVIGPRPAPAPTVTTASPPAAVPTARQPSLTPQHLETCQFAVPQLDRALLMAQCRRLSAASQPPECKCVMPGAADDGLDDP
jgi:hypothetical protein